MLGEVLGAIGGLIGGAKTAKATEKANRENEKNQEKFAKNSLQWKAADAEAAGISKVFAMGAPTTSFSPSSVGSNFDFLGAAGQNIGRAISATQSPGNQANAVPRAAQALQLESLKLDNDLKKSQLASFNKTLNQAGQPPGVPSTLPGAIPGQPLTVEPPTITPSTKIDVEGSSPGVTPFATPENMPVRTASGKTTYMLAPAVQEALESMGFLSQRQAEIRNTVMPLMRNDYRPGVFADPPKGYHSRYNPLTGEYSLRKIRPYHNPRSR